MCFLAKCGGGDEGADGNIAGRADPVCGDNARFCLRTVYEKDIAFIRAKSLDWICCRCNGCCVHLELADSFHRAIGKYGCVVVFPCCCRILDWNSVFTAARQNDSPFAFRKRSARRSKS